MKDLHSATRPFWAIDWKAVLCFLLTVLLCTAGTRWVTHLLVLNRWVSKGILSQSSADFLEDVTVTLIVILLSWVAYVVYRKVRTRSYPGTYAYCFKRKTNGGDVNVVGYFYLRCLLNGEMIAEGASFDWIDNALQSGSKVGWDSENVGASEARQTVICHILYKVKEGDQPKRPYVHGLLQFRLKKQEKGVITNNDVYHGHMQATDPPSSVHIYEKAYGERIARGEIEEPRVKELLEDNAFKMIKRWNRDLGTKT